MIVIISGHDSYLLEIYEGYLNFACNFFTYPHDQKHNMTN